MEKCSTSSILEVSDRDFDIDYDYEILSEWWLAHSSFIPHREHFPQKGIVIEYNKIPVCAGFLYKTDSLICVFEFVVSDPNADKQIRDICLNMLITKAIEWAEDNGFNLIYTSISVPKYIQRLQVQGFIKADTNQTHMFKVVQNV